MSLPGSLIDYRSAHAGRGRLQQIAERLEYLSREPGIAHTAQAKLLQRDARDLREIMEAFLPGERTTLRQQRG
jgi:hypothetical protein